MEEITVLVFFAVLIIGFLIFMGICRWIFRIDEIVDLLKKIASNTNKNPVSPPKPPPAKKQQRQIKCQACGGMVPEDLVSTVALGKLVCPTCKKIIKS